MTEPIASLRRTSRLGGDREAEQLVRERRPLHFLKGSRGMGFPSRAPIPRLFIGSRKPSTFCRNCALGEWLMLSTHRRNIFHVIFLPPQTWVLSRSGAMS